MLSFFKKLFSSLSSKEREQYEAQNQKLASELASLKQDFATEKQNLNDKLSATSENLAKTQDELNISNKNLEQTQNALSTTNENLAKTQSELSTTNKNLAKTQSELSATSKNLNQTKQKLEDTNFKFNFTSSILAAKLENEALKQFQACLEKWHAFSTEGEDLNDELEAYTKLKGIEKNLKIVCACSKLYQNTIVAVGGGFSSGKSAFISSFMEDKEFSLATDIAPTTAIPTYVFHDTITTSLAITNSGAYVDLQKMGDKTHARFSHDFIKSFDFNIKDIVPFMVLGVKMSHQKLCFIDTPGYNPSGAGHTHQDIETAKEYLNKASVLFWLVGLDANGTIGESDIEFLRDLDLGRKELFVILNKADIKSQDDIESILDIVEETLEDYGIEFKGISAYSAKRSKEYAFKKSSLQNFLLNLESQSHNIHKSLVKDLYAIDEKCQKDLLKAIVEKNLKNRELSGLAADLAESNFDDMDSTLYKRIENLKKQQDTKGLKQKLAELGERIEDFKDAIDGVFGKRLELKRRIYTEKDVESEVAFKTISDMRKEKKQKQERETKSKNPASNTKEEYIEKENAAEYQEQDDENHEIFLNMLAESEEFEDFLVMFDVDLLEVWLLSAANSIFDDEGIADKLGLQSSDDVWDYAYEFEDDWKTFLQKYDLDLCLWFKFSSLILSVIREKGSKYEKMDAKEQFACIEEAIANWLTKLNYKLMDKTGKEMDIDKIITYI
ncbi:hypothetical protein BA723_09205 [Helicobacter sp. CLO-3]|uniref:dynamin family protein n=1 Tax=Helicobacter sp. CLO-3 TaxID=211 RepID=UPI000804E416|nr:dynamin family protein [Helicobacter sp. CLO-3]OBV28518.1 hypothetical protein BA723_09205 [Helicobacter sp. CLO-3]